MGEEGCAPQASGSWHLSTSFAEYQTLELMRSRCGPWLSMMSVCGSCKVDGCLQVQDEVDRVLSDREQPDMAGYQDLKYLMRCVNESMRLYPHPPVLLRRAEVADTLPGTASLQLSQIFVAVTVVPASERLIAHAMTGCFSPFSKPAPLS